jgi:hypothetical protein
VSPPHARHACHFLAYNTIPSHETGTYVYLLLNVSNCDVHPKDMYIRKKPEVSRSGRPVHNVVVRRRVTWILYSHGKYCRETQVIHSPYIRNNPFLSQRIPRQSMNISVFNLEPLVHMWFIREIVVYSGFTAVHAVHRCKVMQRRIALVTGCGNFPICSVTGSIECPSLYLTDNIPYSLSDRTARPYSYKRTWRTVIVRGIYHLTTKSHSTIEYVKPY